jgi:hypothetical protein
METLTIVGSVASIFAVGLTLASGRIEVNRLFVGLIVSAVIILAIFMYDNSVLTGNMSGYCPYNHCNRAFGQGGCPYPYVGCPGAH